MARLRRAGVARVDDDVVDSDLVVVDVAGGGLAAAEETSVRVEAAR